MGSILSTDHVQKCLTEFLLHAASVLPAVKCLVEHCILDSDSHKLLKTCIRGDEAVQL